jgi:hypothetical protein
MMPGDPLAELCARGFATLPAVLAPSEVAQLHRQLVELCQQTGHPALFSQADVVLGERTVVSPVGMTFGGLLTRVPQIERILLHPAVLAAFGAALGQHLELELSAGVVSDSSRPFFFWHNHLGGIDGPMWRSRDDVTLRRFERLACTTYLSPLDDDHGVMLVQPRGLGEAVAPPFAPGRDPWPTQTEVRCAAGTTVLLDQVTWHAVTPMRVVGRRAFVSFFVRRAGLAPTVRCDDTVAEALARSAALRRHYALSTTVATPETAQVLA